MEKEVIDLIQAAQSGHDQENPCSPQNHRILVRLSVLVSRNLMDLRGDIAALPEKIAAESMQLVKAETQSAVQQLGTAIERENDKASLPGTWGMAGKWLGGWATIIYLIYTVSEYVFRSKGWV